MQTPLQINFQGGTSSDALSGLIREHVDSIEKVHGRMTSCQVMVQVPDRGGPFSVHVHIALPGGGDLNVDHTPGADERFHDPQFAVNDAFRRAKRQVQDYVRKRRGEVKTLRERVERTINRPESES
ncbi:MAG TPA: HPF/RaiA family ribosome-associated protein [Reyranella sp.]|jgi:ribosome-associated translation inhibitor RaiA|nr:HPF/RaiA family ribosome-associated protein [Reyranella sp.]